MASTALPASPLATDRNDSPVSLVRLYVLRATYLLLVLGAGGMILPVLISHEPTARGVIPAFIGAVALLAIVGLKYPLRMLPLLMFEFGWKSLWLLVFGLPQYLSGQLPPTFAEDFLNITFGVILMPLVIPWGYVWRQYVKAPADRWR
ncbi:MAG TPA: hypothetical protein VK472_01710 [Allosphingosinicella sp.]|nr:hypothetical protein [Allosphingosinicella sp.]